MPKSIECLVARLDDEFYVNITINGMWTFTLNRSFETEKEAFEVADMMRTEFQDLVKR